METITENLQKAAIGEHKNKLIIMNKIAELSGISLLDLCRQIIDDSNSVEFLLTKRAGMPLQNILQEVNPVDHECKITERAVKDGHWLIQALEYFHGHQKYGVDPQDWLEQPRVNKRGDK